MEKLKAGQKFNEIAATYSEDKARSGVTKKKVQSLIKNSYSLNEITFGKIKIALLNVCLVDNILSRVISVG